MKRELRDFINLNVHNNTYGAKAATIKDVFDQWRQKEKLCEHCRRYLTLKATSIHTLTKTIYILAEKGYREIDLYKGLGNEIKEIFDQMD